MFPSMWVIDELTFYLLLPLSWVAVFVLTKKYGKKVPLVLNCWSCNKWSIIEFQHKNAWYCPRCDQYNGFTNDGEYNKDLVETDEDCLSDEETQINVEFSNGLCFACNQKLKMKTQQLADFIPSSDKNFDQEIENYKLSLDKLYDLCFKCKSHVRKTLNNQKSWLLRTQQFYVYKSLDKNQSWFKSVTNFINILLCIFSVCDLLGTISKVKFGNLIQIANHFEKFDFRLIDFSVFNFIFFGIETSFIASALQVLIAIKNHSAYFSLYGGFSQLLIFILNQNIILQELCFCFPWLISIYLKNESLKNVIMINFAQIFVSLSLLVISFLKVKKSFKNSPSHKSPENYNGNSTIANQMNDSIGKKAQKCESLFEASPDDDLKKVFKEACHLNPPSPRCITPVYQHMFGEKPILLPTPKSNFSTESYNTESAMNSPEALKITNDLQTLKISWNQMKKKINKNNGFMVSKQYNESNVSEIFRPKSKITLSPPRLQNVVKTSWVSNGCWKNPKTATSQKNLINDFPSYGPTNLSRSSSQSSGFGSQCTDNSNQLNNSANSSHSSRESSICDEFDRASIFSEPAYYLNSSFNILALNKPAVKSFKSTTLDGYSSILANDSRITKPNIKNNCLVFSQCYENKPQMMFQRQHSWNGQPNVSNTFTPISDTNAYVSSHLNNVYNFNNFSEGL